MNQLKDNIKDNKFALAISKICTSCQRARYKFEILCWKILFMLNGGKL